jgi:hypothetical protein
MPQKFMSIFKSTFNVVGILLLLGIVMKFSVILYIAIVVYLEYWVGLPETSDCRFKEYIVRAPNRVTAVKLTKVHLTVKEITYIYSEDVWGHDMLIIDPSINKD